MIQQQPGNPSEEGSTQAVLETLQVKTDQILAQAVAEVTRRALQPELDPFKCRLEELQAGLEGALNGQVRSLGERVDQLDKTLEAAARSSTASVAQMEHLRGSLDQASQDLTAAGERHGQSATEVARLREEAAQVTARMGETQQRLADLLPRLESVRSDLERLDQAWASTEQRIGDLVRSGLDAQATQRAANQAETLQKLQALQENLGTRLDTLARELETVRQSSTESGQSALRLAWGNLLLLTAASGATASLLWMHISGQ